ncbi:hypothetical protein [Dyella acidiphila]|uniref:Uncharacterized protein n=1 Tax=Dyella acidiphila TaxID=2775866 RepID=A0ABR9G6H4_9GAMM|nr:hypothetical protein [Dyella acidiphila]MBE1159645.1 hypothetical protein [Dyella acidiphila]
MSSHRQSTAGGTYTGSGSSRLLLTSERIASDIDAFNKAGGHIEVLGNTPIVRRSKEAVTAADAKSSKTTLKQTADGK